MPTSYEIQVRDATLEELHANPFLTSDGITVQQVTIRGVYPNTAIVVSYSQGQQNLSKSFPIYDRGYPGGAESPPAGTIASIISAAIVD